MMNVLCMSQDMGELEVNGDCAKLIRTRTGFSGIHDLLHMSIFITIVLDGLSLRMNRLLVDDNGC